MTTQEILRKTCDHRRGYSINSISETTLNPVGCEFLSKLWRIPHKITAQLHRHLIAEAYKTRKGRGSYLKRLDSEYYIVVATDGTFFHVDF